MLLEILPNVAKLSNHLMLNNPIASLRRLALQPMLLCPRTLTSFEIEESEHSVFPSELKYEWLSLMFRYLQYWCLRIYCSTRCVFVLNSSGSNFLKRGTNDLIFYIDSKLFHLHYYWKSAVLNSFLLIWNNFNFKNRCTLFLKKLTGNI